MDLHHALPPSPFPPYQPPRRRPRRPVDSLRRGTSSSGRHLAALRRLPLLNLPAGACQRCAAEPPRLPFGPPRDVRRVLEPSDRRKLENSWLGLRMRTDPVDLRLCTETDGGWNLKRASVNTIVEECLGFEVEQRKEIGISDWDEEFLSHEQVEYATVDAHCAFLIARDCKVWNFRSFNAI
ncbi:hypothetical protein HN51_004250 [Arachis hypogaea]